MVTYKGTPIQILVDFSAENLQPRKKWGDTSKLLEKQTKNQKMPNEEHYAWKNCPSKMKQR